jgi:ribosomal protein S18 acetylase RimI-like enzyme
LHGKIPVTLELERYRPEHLRQTVSMWRASKRTAFPYVVVMQQYTLENDLAYFRDSLAPRCEIWLARRDGGIVGMLALEGSFIDQLFVAVESQRTGVGTALLRKAMERSPEVLRLFTFRKNLAARAFYEKHGFAIVRFGVSAPPENEPDVEYCWDARRDRERLPEGAAKPR